MLPPTFCPFPFLACPSWSISTWVIDSCGWNKHPLDLKSWLLTLKTRHETLESTRHFLIGESHKTKTFQNTKQIKTNFYMLFSISKLLVQIFMRLKKNASSKNPVHLQPGLFFFPQKFPPPSCRISWVDAKHSSLQLVPTNPIELQLLLFVQPPWWNQNPTRHRNPPKCTKKNVLFLQQACNSLCSNKKT